MVADPADVGHMDALLKVLYSRRYPRGFSHGYRCFFDKVKKFPLKFIFFKKPLQKNA